MPRIPLRPNGSHTFDQALDNLAIENENPEPAASVSVEYDGTTIKKTISPGKKWVVIHEQAPPPIVVTNASRVEVIVIY